VAILTFLGGRSRQPLHYTSACSMFFRRNNVAGILANGRPNKGTHRLVDAKGPGLWVVPLLRPYRTRDDVQNWSTDPAIYDLIEAEYKRGYFRGVGEFHIYGNAAQAALAQT